MVVSILTEHRLVTFYSQRGFPGWSSTREIQDTSARVPWMEPRRSCCDIRDMCYTAQHDGELRIDGLLGNEVDEDGQSMLPQDVIEEFLCK